MTTITAICGPLRFELSGVVVRVYGQRFPGETFSENPIGRFDHEPDLQDQGSSGNLVFIPLRDRSFNAAELTEIVSYLKKQWDLNGENVAQVRSGKIHPSTAEGKLL